MIKFINKNNINNQINFKKEENLYEDKSKSIKEYSHFAFILTSKHYFFKFKSIIFWIIYFKMIHLIILTCHNFIFHYLDLVIAMITYSKFDFFGCNENITTFLIILYNISIFMGTYLGKLFRICFLNIILLVFSNIQNFIV